MATYSPKQAFKLIGKGPQRAKQIIKDAVKAGTIKEPRVGTGRWTKYEKSEIDKLAGGKPTTTSKKVATTTKTPKAASKPKAKSGYLIVEVPASDMTLVQKFGWTILKSI